MGRSGEAAGRIRELCASFPPGAGLAWRALHETAYPTAAAAHAVEQRVLGLCAAEGWSIGGKFLIAPAEAVIALTRP